MAFALTVEETVCALLTHSDYDPTHSAASAWGSQKVISIV